MSVQYILCGGQNRQPPFQDSHTLAARGLEEHDVRITLIFSRIISFMSFTVLLSHNMYFFRRISDSQFTS
jgi:hypothetical protein